MNYEYKVIEKQLGNKASDTEFELNNQARDGWEHYAISTLGPIPSLWLYFRRPLRGIGGAA